MQFRGYDDGFLRRVAAGGEITAPAQREQVHRMLADARMDDVHRFAVSALRSAATGRYWQHAEATLNALDRRVRGEVTATLVGDLLGGGRRGGGLATGLTGQAGSVLGSYYA